MKKSLLLISAAALGSLALLGGCSDDSKSAAPAKSADQPSADAPANPDADDSPEQKAVDTYRLRFIRAMLQKEPAVMDRSSSEEVMMRFLQTMQHAYDKTPTDGLPEEHAAFVKDFRAQFGVLLKMLATADTSTEEGQTALAAANEKAEQAMQKLEEKHPNAYSSLAHVAMMEFFGETLSKLGYEDKANELIEQKPDLEEDLPQLMKEVAKRLIQEIDEELAE